MAAGSNIMAASSSSSYSSSSSSSKPNRLTASAPPQSKSSSGHHPNNKQHQQQHRHQYLSYMHRPPRIVPNYGRRPRGVLPKSSVSRVLLYDNVTQEQMLTVRMTHLSAEQRKTSRLMDLHRKSFITRRQQKERQMAETALHVDHDLLERGLLSVNLHPSSTKNNTGNTTTSRTRAGPTTQPFDSYTPTETISAAAATEAVAEAVAEAEAVANNDVNDNTDSGQVLEHHVTQQQANGTDDSAAKDVNSEQWASQERGGIPMGQQQQLVTMSLDRPHRAVTSDCVPRPSPLHAGKSAVHGVPRTAHAAIRMHRGGGGGGGEMMTTSATTMMMKSPRRGEQREDSLPDIHAVSQGQARSGGNKALLMDSHQPNGLTRILHTYHHQDSLDAEVGERGGGSGEGGMASWATPTKGGRGGGGSWQKTPRAGGDSRGVGAPGGRTSTADERYRELERALVRIEPPNDGYLELSPSFHSPRQTSAFFRPSSLLHHHRRPQAPFSSASSTSSSSSSFFPRRRRSSASSSVSAVTVQSVHDL